MDLIGLVVDLTGFLIDSDSNSGFVMDLNGPIHWFSRICHGITGMDLDGFVIYV